MCGAMTRLMLIEPLIYRTGSLSATTSSPVGIRGKEANGFKPNVYRGEKDGETLTAFRMELQNWAGAMHDSMLQVLETAEAEQGRIDEANVRKGGLNQETVDDFKEMDRRMYQLLFVCRKGTAKNYVCVPGRSGFKAWKQMASHFDPRIGADRSVLYSSLTHRVGMRGLTSSRPRTLEGGKSTLQAWAKRTDEDATILALKSTMLEHCLAKQWC